MSVNMEYYMHKYEMETMEYPWYYNVCFLAKTSRDCGEKGGQLTRKTREASF